MLELRQADLPGLHDADPGRHALPGLLARPHAGAHDGATSHGDPVLTYVLIGINVLLFLGSRSNVDGVLRPRARRPGPVADRRRVAAAHRRVPARPGLRLHPHRLQHVPALHPRAAARAEPRQVALRRASTSPRCSRARSARSCSSSPDTLHGRRLGRGVRADGRGVRVPARARGRPDGSPGSARRSSSTSPSRSCSRGSTSRSAATSAACSAARSPATRSMKLSERRSSPRAAGAGLRRHRGWSRSPRPTTSARDEGRRSRAPPRARRLRAASGTRSGCRMCASSSSPSTSRGPGREKYAAASTATIAARAERGELVLRSPRPPRARARRRSRTASRRPPRAAAAATSSHVRTSECSPGRPSTSMPPAYSISCGVQWPATKTGSSHSSAATGTGGAPRTASRTRSMRAAASCTRSTPASFASVAWASVRTSPSISPSVCGSSEITSGRGPCAPPSPARRRRRPRRRRTAPA